MMQRRRDTRHEVHLAVRFDDAAEFVTQYAENLSRGGLFVRGANRLEVGAQERVDVSLPRFGTFRLVARVAHVSEIGRDQMAGAGLEIVERPPGFDDALHAYLLQLGRRKDFVVLVDSEAAREMLRRAGFMAALLPPPGRLLAAIARRSEPVLAIVVSRELAPDYLAIAERAGGSDMILAYDGEACVRDLLPALDAQM